MTSLNSVVETTETAAAGERHCELSRRLDRWFVDAGSVVVALSGGVDSALLAVSGSHALGPRALVVTGISPSYPAVQREMVEGIVARFNLAHRWIETNEIDDSRYVRNSPDRCYFCKSELYGQLASIASNEGFAVVVDGTNSDDLSDHRPGRIAAAECDVRSPLVELGFRKGDVRAVARQLGLAVWDAPASACLSSRIPHGTPVTIGRLQRVERAEAALRALGFRQLRVRHHETDARVELAVEELPRVEDPATADAIAAAVKGAGFEEVVIDPAGYRSRE